MEKGIQSEGTASTVVKAFLTCSKEIERFKGHKAQLKVPYLLERLNITFKQFKINFG